jgi:hypothetical protein
MVGVVRVSVMGVRMPDRPGEGALHDKAQHRHESQSRGGEA